jgi:hypothetical protein
VNVRPYPFDRLPRLTKADAALESAFAAHLAARPAGDRLAALAGGPVDVKAVRVVKSLRAPVSDTVVGHRAPDASRALDPHAAACELRVAGTTFEVRGSSRAVRRLAQRLLGGPDELDAPRPLTLVEERLWAHVVATAIDDLGIRGEVIAASARSPGVAVVIDVVLGDVPLTVELRGESIELRAPPLRAWPAWVDHAMLELPVVVARCALPADALARLAVRDVIIVDRVGGDAELAIFGGAVGLRAASNAVSATACTGYVPRDMSLPDEAHVELTVALGTTQMTLRQVLDLSIGQVISLGRPLAGPFELRAAGRIVGRGELLDVDGELGVRIVSLESGKL